MRHIPRTTSILATRSMLNPLHPEKNEFHQSWAGYPGTYLVLTTKDFWSGKSKTMILSGSGAPKGYPNVGDVIHAHHDQTLADLGRWTVMDKVTHENVAALRYVLSPKASAPLWVYK